MASETHDNLPKNLFSSVLTDSYTRGVVTVSSYGREVANPLVSQQECAGMLKFLTPLLSQSTPVKDSEFVRLVQSEEKVIERILCGPAASITCVGSIGYDQHWNEEDIPNATSISEMFTSLYEFHGKPSVNPETNAPFSDGWRIFANTDKEVSKWEIYHHAIAYYWNSINKGVNTIGMRNLSSVKELEGFLLDGGKAMISVPNSIVRNNQRNGETLQSGSHLISLIGISQEYNAVCIADPYHAAHSLSSKDPIPEWIKIDKFDTLFTSGATKGIAFTARNKGFDRIKTFTYPFAVPLK